MRAVVFNAKLGHWQMLEDPEHVVVAASHDEIVPALKRVEEFVNRDGYIAAGFLSYEAAPAFDSALTTHGPEPEIPLLLFGVFAAAKRYDFPHTVPHYDLDWSPTVSPDEYDACIARIKHLIAEGDTYQVNFSFRLRSPFQEDALGLFHQLVRSQPSSTAAFIETETLAICSASPELFFRLDGNEIVARPMKGTAPRGLTLRQDQERAAALSRSEKERSENLMIVDMMRNDLGRIAEVDTVRVPALFDVERYPTVWQMTSTVTASTTASVSEILAALFPCASVTGAPKARTMEIISGLESTPRNVYCGAIGTIAPERQAQFNVAIRTVTVDLNMKRAEYGVGGGIVWGSTAESEYSECLTKARILTNVSPEFSLFETMLFTDAEGFFLLDRHLRRLRDSAEYFGFSFDEQEARHALTNARASFLHESCRVRLELKPDGAIVIAVSVLNTKSAALPVRVRFASKPVDSKNMFLYHKTTHRVTYDEAKIAVPDCDDVLLWNERDEITESTIANVVVQIGDELLTPPVDCGLLAGTYREHLLDEGKIRERVITKADVQQADALHLINAVRKWRKAVLA